MAVSRRSYSTDLTDAEWKILEPLLPAEKPGGRHRLYPMRKIINALRYFFASRLFVATAAARFSALASRL